MNQEIEKKYQRLRSIFFGLCIVAAGLLFLITVKNIAKTLSAENWRVYSGALDAGDKSGTHFFYRTSWIKYSYEIDGKKYQGTRIGYGISNTDEIQVSDKNLRIYVNPNDYTESVLVTGLKKTHLIGLLFSGGFLWLAFYLWRRTQ